MQLMCSYFVVLTDVSFASWCTRDHLRWRLMAQGNYNDNLTLHPMDPHRSEPLLSLSHRSLYSLYSGSQFKNHYSSSRGCLTSNCGPIKTTITSRKAKTSILRLSWPNFVTFVSFFFIEERESLRVCHSLLNRCMYQRSYWHLELFCWNVLKQYVRWSMWFRHAACDTHGYCFQSLRLLTWLIS